MNNSFINSIISAIAQKNEAQMCGQLNTALLHSCVYSLRSAVPDAGRLYLCIAAEEAVILMIDDYQGDELADEAPFNEGLPLYFSEASYRISPVFRLYAVTESLRKLLGGKTKSFASVLITTSRIINDDDIQGIWKNMRVSVRMVKRLDALSITTDKSPDFLKGFADIYSSMKSIESDIDLKEYGRVIDGSTQLSVEEVKVSAGAPDQPLFYMCGFTRYCFQSSLKAY